MDHREIRDPARIRARDSCRAAGRYIHRRMAPVRYRLGRQGATLLVFAWLDLGIAWSLLDGSPTGPSSVASYRVVRQVAPYTAWAVVWAAVGVTCAVGAWLTHRQAAFAAAIAIKLLWASLLYLAFVSYDVPRAWVPALQWCGFAALVTIIAGWREAGRK